MKKFYHTQGSQGLLNKQWNYKKINKKKFKMKKLIVALIIIQLILIAIGFYFLISGKIAVGIFNIVLNTIFLIMNVNSIKKL